MQVVREAYGVWEAAECGAPLLEIAAGTGSGAARGDNVNTIQWVDEGWVERGLTADAAGVTDVQYAKDASGEWAILEADLYLNADAFDWVLRGASAPTERDLFSVAAHELGHVLGLLHPCETDGADGAPGCSIDPRYSDHLMYPLYSGTSTVSSDDSEGLCFLYSSATCTSPQCDAGTPDAGHAPDGSPPGSTLGAIGDPCTDYGDCESGVCAEKQCSRACRDDVQCLEGQSCDLILGVCLGQGKALGETCASGNDCSSTKCVDGTSEGAICSRACGGDEPECPAMWQCRAVSGESVCAPIAPRAAGGGCALANSPAVVTVPGALSWAGLSLLLLTVRRGRRRQAHRARSVTSAKSLRT